MNATERAYLKVSDRSEQHVRDLPLDAADDSGNTAGTALAKVTANLIAGVADMRRRGVIDEENDGQWLDKIIAEAQRALKLVGHRLLEVKS